MQNVNLKSCVSTLIVATLLGMYGCTGSPEFVSELSVEDKISRLRIGESELD